MATSNRLKSSELPPLQDSLYIHNPFAPISSPATRRYLIFIIPGNPGLIEFYRPFANLLFAKLSAQKNSTADNIAFEIYGHSFAGFELNSHPQHPQQCKRSWWSRRGKPGSVGLKETIDHVDVVLRESVHRLSEGGRAKPRVVLMGHSVGAYVLLELVRRHRRRLEESREKEKIEIVGGISVFPTVVDIGMSKSGVGLTVSLSQK
jgi:pimeloyl-ACP methyl ester carboxylesterase